MSMDWLANEGQESGFSFEVFYQTFVELGRLVATS